MSDVPTIGDLQIVYGNIVSIILALAGIILFIMLIVGGIKFITSGGDAKLAETAKNTITHAIGGLLLILVAYLILVLIHTITGVDILHFTVVQ